MASSGNAFVCKQLGVLSTNINIYKKKKNQASFEVCCHDDSLAQEKCYMVRGAKAAWHISVEFITHMKRNQFYSTVTLTFTEKWNGGFRNEDFKWNPYQIFCDGAILMSPLPEDPPCPMDAFLVTADDNLFNQVCWVIKKFNLDWLLNSFIFNVSV